VQAQDKNRPQAALLVAERTQAPRLPRSAAIEDVTVRNQWTHRTAVTWACASLRSSRKVAWTARAAQLLSARRDALDMPRHVGEEDARRFALALGKMVLTSGVGEVVDIARLNVRAIAV
jgi:hypothetical protein